MLYSTRNNSGRTGMLGLAALICLGLTTIAASDAAAAEKKTKIGQASINRLVATADRATAELKFVHEPADAKRPAGVVQPRAAVGQRSNALVQSVILDRALRNGSRDGFRQDVQRMQNQGFGVYSGWFQNWFPRRRAAVGVPFPFFGK